MEEKDYRLVFVGNTQVGLMGLKEIFEELKSQKGMPESALKEMLVDRVSIVLRNQMSEQSRLFRSL